MQLGGADLSGELSPHLRRLIIERLEAPRLSWFEALLKDPAPKLAGSATFDLNWQDPNPSEAKGEAKLTLKADTIRAKDTAFSGDVSMNVALGRDKESVTLSPLELELSNATFSTEDNRSDRFAARIVSNSSRFMSKREPVAFQGTFDIHVRPAEALLPVLMADAPATLSQVLLALDALHARLAVFIASDLTRVELLQSASGAIQAEGAWQETSSSSKGAFLLNTWLVNLGVSLKDGESSFELGADQKFLKKSP